MQNKYYPPSFDPKKIPPIQRPKNHQKKIRFMLPMLVRCTTCGNYMSQGTKFNSREEEVIGETYLGIKLFRFYIKCTNCSAEVTIRTDPKNTGYIAESGATCPYNEHEEEKKKKHEEREDALKSLEERTIVSKREIDVMAALDEMKSMKSRRASVNIDSMLEALRRRKKEEEEEDNKKQELLIKSIKFGKRTRVDEEKNNEAFDEKKPKRRECTKSSIQISSLRVIPKKTAKLPIGIESLCHNYGTDSDEE